MSIAKDMQELLKRQRFNDSILSEVGSGKVLLIGTGGKVLGKDISAEEAVSRAKEDGADIMLVESKQKEKGKAKGPFVCKYFNMEEWMEERKAHLLKKKTSVFSEVQKAKEMKFSINITEHDADTKCRKIESFLSDGYRYVLFL
jgi:translation initiation factor IF-3